MRNDVLGLVENRDYDGLVRLLEQNEEGTLNKLFDLTRGGEINFREGGKEVWKYITQYYTSQDTQKIIDDICIRLSNVQKEPVYLALEDFVIGFAAFLGGVFTGASPRGAFYLSDKVENYFKRRAVRKYRPLLGV